MRAMNQIDMTILVVADFGYYEGGAAKVALDSVKLLHQAGYKVILFCGSDQVDPSISALGIRIEKLGMYQLKDNPSKINAMLTGIWNAKAAARLKALLGELDPAKTIVHIHTWTKILSASIFSVLRKSSFRTEMTCHDYFLICPNGEFFDFQKKSICHRKGGSISCLLCNCDSRNYVQKVWRWIRQQVVTHEIKRFMNLGMLTISDLCEKVFRRSLGDNRIYRRVNNPLKIARDDGESRHGSSWLFVGRVSADKGAELFVRTISEIGYKGVVVGMGPDLDALKAKWPKIDYRGWIETSKVRDLMKRDAYALIFPSLWHETAGLTPIEAMSVGVPCIISDATAAVEYVEDGKTGLLFKSGDVEDLKRKITMLKNPTFRQHLSENIRNLLDIRKWSEETHLTSLSEIYEKGR